MVSQMAEVPGSVAQFATDAGQAALVAGLAVSAWRGFALALSPVIGTAGAGVLFERSLHLARTQHPALEALRDDSLLSGDFAGLEALLRSRPAAEAAAIQALLIEAFQGLLKGLGAVAAVPLPVLDQSLQQLRDLNAKLLDAAASAKREQEDLRRRTRESQARLLAMVAHELRNPLAPIQTAAELLVRARDDDAGLLRLQAIIKRQVGHLSRLVEDLLDTARVTFGKLRVDRRRIDLRDVLDTARETAQPAIDARQQRLDWCMPTGRIDIDGDALRLTQVFGNLLDNASKYTADAGVLALQVVRQEASVVVRVSDNGRGIPASALAQIFELFDQDVATPEGGRSGLGIGLAIVREVVNAHGGSVEARSAGAELGSEFVVTLPASRPGDPG